MLGAVATGALLGAAQGFNLGWKSLLASATAQSDGEAGGYTGRAVSVSSWGNRLAVGEAKADESKSQVSAEMSPVHRRRLAEDLDCPTGQIPNGAGDACVCPTGQVPNGAGNPCETCPTGQIPNGAADACEACPTGQVPNGAGDACEACPFGQPNLDGDACVCPTGQVPNGAGDACVCPTGQIP